MPVESEEVQWKVDKILMCGTITRPKEVTPTAFVVFVAGSGPTDRDWCSPLLLGANGSAKLLADVLAAKGFLTLRYDKRASGPHVQENVPKMAGKISMQSHIDELSGAIDTLVSQNPVARDNLFALTSSEGAIHAINYQIRAKHNRFKGLVLTGAPGRAIGQVGRSQVANQLASLPNAETLMKHYDEAIAAFVAGKTVMPDSSLPQGVQQMLLGLANPLNLPFARELWTYNPSEYLAKVQEPILIVIGKKDVQTDWQADGKPLEAALAQNGNAVFVYPENADHVLKHEETPHEKLSSQVLLRYNAQDRHLDQEALDAICGWLVKQANYTSKV
ncbi:MAG: alpha/beta hydrolase [Candidatus Bathyarchaeota archaeon]|nr:alpha/beta hydrolase [Candidatus Bathyarchaeota archaeon]